METSPGGVGTAATSAGDGGLARGCITSTSRFFLPAALPPNAGIAGSTTGAVPTGVTVVDCTPADCGMAGLSLLVDESVIPFVDSVAGVTMLSLVSVLLVSGMQEQWVVPLTSPKTSTTLPLTFSVADILVSIDGSTTTAAAGLVAAEGRGLAKATPVLAAFTISAVESFEDTIAIDDAFATDGNSFTFSVAAFCAGGDASAANGVTAPSVAACAAVGSDAAGGTTAGAAVGPTATSVAAVGFTAALGITAGVTTADGATAGTADGSTAVGGG